MIDGLALSRKGEEAQPRTNGKRDVQFLPHDCDSVQISDTAGKIEVG